MLTEVLDGRFVPWTDSLQWESYVDYYAEALRRRGNSCIKYVPSILAKRVSTHVHRFGHTVKRVPVHGRLMAPGWLFRPRPYAQGYTTIAHPLHAPSFTFNLAREAALDGVELLHYTSYYSTYFAASPLAGLGVPVVAQYTGGALPQAGAAKAAWRVCLIPPMHLAKRILVGDYRAERRSLQADFELSRDKLEGFDAPVVDSGVFYERNKDESAKSLGFDRSRFNILSVSFIPMKRSLHLSKDPFMVVDILDRLLREHRRAAMLHIVGWGPGEETLKRYVAEIGMAEDVKFHGRVEHAELPRYYSACDLLFVPYTFERLNESSVTFEAFACGRPVAGIKRFADTATDQPGGFLVERDPAEGAETLWSNLQDGPALRRRAAEALDIARGHTVEEAGRRLEEIYRKVVAEAGSGRHNSKGVRSTRIVTNQAGEVRLPANR